MRRGIFFIIIAMISVGIILLNTSNTLKYLTCEDPNNITVEVTTTTENIASITIYKDTTNESFGSYESHIDGSTLYIGAKYTYNPLSATTESVYTFEVNIEGIDKIIIKGGTIEVQVYPINDPQ